MSPNCRGSRKEDTGGQLLDTSLLDWKENLNGDRKLVKIGYQRKSDGFEVCPRKIIKKENGVRSGSPLSKKIPPAAD
jgi:hypothetical protein